MPNCVHSHRTPAGRIEFFKTTAGIPPSQKQMRPILLRCEVQQRFRARLLRPLSLGDRIIPCNEARGGPQIKTKPLQTRFRVAWVQRKAPLPTALWTSDIKDRRQGLFVDVVDCAVVRRVGILLVVHASLLCISCLIAIISRLSYESFSVRPKLC
ncbi:hypothetical protein CDAR_401011 [Caerostris darwini]|uniref:Uncharacterized protein n=1 Tax=Caerostris darwini TaxID=1538125 RepID=A0AAV4TL37_9ARAC|nr:hypothetical protein CDAR_401011 [Caerostris darwini]